LNADLHHIKLLVSPA